VLPNIGTLSRKTGADLPKKEAVRGKSPSDLPKRLSLRGEIVARFPLTEVFSDDIIPLLVDVETMSVRALLDKPLF
jgi:hypothetical protein